MDQNFENRAHPELSNRSFLDAQAVTFDLACERIDSPFSNVNSILDLERFTQALNNGAALDKPICGLFGRIVRGNCDQDFLSLSEDPRRKVVFLLDSQGLSELPGMSGYQMLIHVGHTPAEIHRRVVEQGKSFKLVLFPDSHAVRLANWDGVLEAVIEAYPEHAASMQRHRDALERFSLTEIEQQVGFKFADVFEHDLRFMTSERFANSEQTLWQTRAFLYHIVQLRELFSGDGFTHTADGRRGVREYLIPNRAIEQLAHRTIVDIDVKVPIN